MADRGSSAEFRMAGFRAEAQALASAGGGPDEPHPPRPSPCPPGATGALLSHTITAAGRIDQAVAAARESADARDGAGPRGRLVDARGYYSPGERFSSAVNAARIDTAAQLASDL